MTAPAPAARDEGARLRVLDGLRFLAAMMVLLHHWVGQGSGAWERRTPELFPTLHPQAAYGWMGVELFFLISGFVICMSSWGRSLGSFFASRVGRLYPAYWVGVLATTLLVIELPLMFKPLEPSQVLVNLTMLQEPLHVPAVDNVYWTLAVELRFYVLFALTAVWGGLTYRRAVLFCVLWTAASLIAPDLGIPGVSYLLTPEYSMYFVAGVAMYLMYRFRPTPLLWGIVALSWVRAEYGLVAKLRDMSGYVSAELTWRHGSVVLIAFFVVMLAVALHALDGVRWPWLTQAGALTYPLYLLHMIVGWTLIRKWHGHWSTWPLFGGLLLILLAVSWLVNELVERPLGSALRRALERSVAEAARDGR